MTRQLSRPVTGDGDAEARTPLSSLQGVGKARTKEAKEASPKEGVARSMAWEGNDNEAIRAVLRQNSDKE